MKTQILGACQACLRDFVVHGALDASAIVLHGYERPGTGYIIGHCPGTSHPPFELSCEYTKKWREALITQVLPGVENELAGYLSGANKTFIVSHYDRAMRSHIEQRVTEGSAKNPAPWDKTEPDWKSLREIAIRKKRALIAQILADADWLGERIASWVHSPEKLRAGYPREPLSREGKEAAAARKLKLDARAQAKADRTARSNARREKAVADCDLMAATIQTALGRDDVKAMLAVKASWFGGCNMGTLDTKDGLLKDMLTRYKLLAVLPGAHWDLETVIANRTLSYTKNPEDVRRDLASVLKDLKKELAYSNIKLGGKTKRAGKAA